MLLCKPERKSGMIAVGKELVAAGSKQVSFATGSFVPDADHVSIAALTTCSKTTHAHQRCRLSDVAKPKYERTLSADGCEMTGT